MKPYFIYQIFCFVWVALFVPNIAHAQTIEQWLKTKQETLNKQKYLRVKKQKKHSLHKLKTKVASRVVNKHRRRASKVTQNKDKQNNKPSGLKPGYVYLTGIIHIRRDATEAGAKIMLYYNQRPWLVSAQGVLRIPPRDMATKGKRVTIYIDKVEDDKVWLRTQQGKIAWELHTPLPNM